MASHCTTIARSRDGFPPHVGLPDMSASFEVSKRASRKPAPRAGSPGRKQSFIPAPIEHFIAFEAVLKEAVACIGTRPLSYRLRGINGTRSCGLRKTLSCRSLSAG